MKHRILLALLPFALSAAFPALAQTATAPAGSTGQCKDGSYTSAAFKMGACRGHKGVQAWFGEKAAAGKSATSATRPASAKGIGSAGMKSPAPAVSTPTVAPAPTVAKPMPAAAPSRPAAVATRAPAPARPSRAMPAPGPVATGGGNGQVWVNMKTKVYHCQGDRWYGTSKDGQYMSESAAIAAGARGSRGKSCATH